MNDIMNERVHIDKRLIQPRGLFSSRKFRVYDEEWKEKVKLGLNTVNFKTDVFVSINQTFKIVAVIAVGNDYVQNSKLGCKSTTV